MQHFNAKELNTKQMYKFLTGSIIPRPIAWITTQNPETQVVNAAPFSFFSVASNVLPLISVANRTLAATVVRTKRCMLFPFKRPKFR